MNFAQESEHQLLTRHMREQIERVREIKGLIRKILQAGSVDLVRACVGQVPQIFARLADQIRRDIDAMDFKKVTAHRAHQPPGAASDIESAPMAALLGLQAVKLRFEIVNDAGSG